jgi:hypothetical protein
MVNSLSFDSRVQDMSRRSTEITTVKIPKDSGGSYERGFEGAVPGIDSLSSFEKEQTRPWAVVSFNQSHANTSSVWDDSRDIHWKRVNPFSIYRKHMSDQVCRALRAVYGTALPV